MRRLGGEGATGGCRRAGGGALAVTTQEALLFWSFRGAPGPRSLSHPENEISKDLLPGRPRCVGGHRAGVERYGESGDGIRGSMSSRRNGDDVAAAGGWQYIFGPSSERVDKIPAAATIRSCVARATSVYYDPAQHTFDAGRVTGYTASS